MDLEDSKLVARSLLTELMAQLQVDKSDQPLDLRVERIKLDTARLEHDPKEFKFPFRQVMIKDSTDVAANVNFKASRDELDKALNMKLNDKFRGGEKYFTSGFFHWDAQPGKWVDVLFIVNSNFESGRSISVNGGGVSINEGASSSQSLVAMTGPGTWDEVLASNLDRKTGYIFVDAGQTLWISSESAGTAPFKYTGPQVIPWKNTAALYGELQGAAGNIAIQENE